MCIACGNAPIIKKARLTLETQSVNVLEMTCTVRAHARVCKNNAEPVQNLTRAFNI